MKSLLSLPGLLLILSAGLRAQLEPFQLDSMIVTDLRFYGSVLYASTFDRGVFSRGPSDTGWTALGLENKKIRTVYPHKVGALDFAITAGIEPDRPGGDSTLVYCSRPEGWVPTDTGMDHQLTQEIRSIDGIPNPAICGETFAAAPGRVYRKKTTVWEKVFEGFVVNVVRVAPDYTIWIGGETLIFSPFLAKSKDLGDTWTMMQPDLAGDNACDAIAFDPSDTNIIYAGMEGAVIKTTDGGANWSVTGLHNNQYYLFGLAVDPSRPGHLFAGGAARPPADVFGLSESTDGGATWTAIPAPAGTGGVSSLALNPKNPGELYVATLGSGVFRYHSPPVKAEVPPLPEKFLLYQNYPNPFNPTTSIRYALGKNLPVSLKVYDVTGREIAALAAGTQGAGVHEVVWTAGNLPGGVYFCRLQTPEITLTRKLVLMR